MASKPKLTRTDWIKAAFRALTSGGPQAIRVEVIARGLNMSKGSFYWHFKDVAALKAAMVEHWLELGTRQVITALDSEASPPRARLAQLMKLAAAGQGGPYGGPKVEAAIRNWARSEGFVAEAVAETDQARISYVAGLMQAAGASQAVARQNAKILYATLIGLEQLAGQDEVVSETLLLRTLNLLQPEL